MSKPQSNPERQKAIESVLVGADPGGYAKHAVARAHEFAERDQARVGLVAAVPVPPFLWPGLKAGELDRVHSSALESARQAVLDGYGDLWNAGSVGGTLEESLTVVAGHPAEVVLRESGARDADMILLGAHGEHELLDFGNTSRTVLARSSVPVWVQAGEARPIGTILVATDLSDHSIKAVQFARALALQLGSRLRVQSSYSLPAFAAAAGPESGAMPGYVIEAERDAAKQQLEGLIEATDWAGLEVETDFTEGEAVGSILRGAEEADLVVMGTHGRTGLARLLLGSVAFSVLKRSPKPVVVVPDADRDWVIE